MALVIPLSLLLTIWAVYVFTGPARQESKEEARVARQQALEAVKVEQAARRLEEEGRTKALEKRAIRGKVPAKRAIEARESEGKRMESVNYTSLRRWKPDNNPRGFGVELLLEEHLSKEEIISFVKELSVGRAPVVIKIYSTREAYQEELTNSYTAEYDRGFLVFYVKNTTGSGPYAGCNEIRWMQAEGKFADLFGQKTRF